jgi:hypothetical protein
MALTLGNVQLPARMNRRRSSVESIESMGNLSDILGNSMTAVGRFCQMVRRLRTTVQQWPVQSWRAFVNRGYVFAFNSFPMACWDYLLSGAALYCAIYMPFALVFERWDNEAGPHSIMDILFISDVFVKMRTSFRDRGYDVTDPELVRRGYMHDKMLPDIIACFPIDLLQVMGVLQPTKQVRVVGLLRLLRLVRVGKLWRKLDHFAPEVAGAFRIAALMGCFLLVAHWFGLMWYAIVIAPLEDSGNDAEPWFWRDDPSQGLTPQTSILYVCSLYW